MSKGRVFFYVQHLLGIGHTMRAAALTRAMQRAGLDVNYVSGGFETLETGLGGAARVQLPPVRAADAGFKTLVGADGAPIDDAWRARRKAALLDAFAAAGPDVLLIEMFPFGRWPFRFELLPLLDAARGRARVACSVRDILVAKTEPARLDRIADLIRRSFDAVLVHGDPRFIAFGETFAAADRIADRIVYTGYVAPEPTPNSATAYTPPEVLVSAGGGATGGALMRAALAARPLSAAAELPWRLLAGPNLAPEDRAHLAPAPGVTVEGLRPDFRALLSAAALSVSQAGYNTVMDLLTCRTRSVLVPFSTHGQTEQGLRARRLAARGWVHTIPEDGLTPQRLAAAIDRAMTQPSPAPVDLDLDGARRSAAIVAGLAAGRDVRDAGIPPAVPVEMAL